MHRINRARSLNRWLVRVSTATLLCISCVAAVAAESWSFVWVGATRERLTVVEGIAKSTPENGSLLFDISGNNSKQYAFEAKIAKDGAVEAGFSGVGDDYRGVTFLTGRYTKQRSKSGKACGVEMIQVQNAFNSISIKRNADLPKCEM